ncbi:MAG: hypothetical protein HXS40_05855 [Theionarchaea archaeon]|nr:hypothetical protein [Theionarchaea archaeon]
MNPKRMYSMGDTTSGGATPEIQSNLTLYIGDNHETEASPGDSAYNCTAGDV